MHIILNAIASTAPLDRMVILKGGILMGLVYNSRRLTADIDLTADVSFEGDITADQIVKQLDQALPRTAAALGYAGLTVKVHSTEQKPRGQFKAARFPALKTKIRSARRHGGMQTFVDVDISFKEPEAQVETLELGGENGILAYSFEDLIAEKYRAMLQQVPRNRNRRQDVYDLNLLIEADEFDGERKKRILDALVVKCRSREIEPACNSLDDPEIRRRSGADWQTMKLELGELPEFESCFVCVAKFYRDLPWD